MINHLNKRVKLLKTQKESLKIKNKITFLKQKTLMKAIKTGFIRVLFFINEIRWNFWHKLLPLKLKKYKG